MIGVTAVRMGAPTIYLLATSNFTGDAKSLPNPGFGKLHDWPGCDALSARPGQRPSDLAAQ